MSKVTIDEIVYALHIASVNLGGMKPLAERIKAHGIAPPEGMCIVPIDTLKNLRELVEYWVTHIKPNGDLGITICKINGADVATNWIPKAIANLERVKALELPKQEPVALAMRFHEAYERLAPSFGYETRDSTKEFNPDSPNGKLMIAVCAELYASQPKVEYVPISDWDKIKIAETKNGIRLELINYIEEEVVRRMKEQGLV